MCDQSEITYAPSEIVWVKLGPVWWPGEVQDYNSLPEEITSNLRKQPIAVVKFFQEDSYEYIKNLNHIYRYNCLKKNEFIQKGLDLCRTKSRDAPSNMKMFPEDIVTAEKRTGGNPNILQSEEFAPSAKKSYQELFATPKKPKDGKEGSGSGRRGRPSEGKANSKASPMTPVQSPSVRSITHPRFIGRSTTPNHESRVRQQPPPDSDDAPPRNVYKCHSCDFTTIRLNVIVLHNKSHTGSNADFSPKDKDILTKKFTPKLRVNSTPKMKAVGEAMKRKSVNESPSTPKRAHLSPVTTKKENEKQSPSSTSEPKATPEVTSEAKSVPKKRGAKPTKMEKVTKVMKENETIRNDLLKDWDEEDETAEEEEKSKQHEDKSCVETEESTSVDSEIQNKDQEVDEKLEEKAPEKSCFDFDESEDIVSHKKPIAFSRKTSAVGSDGVGSVSEKKPDEEVDKFSMEVDNLLKETALPELPELKLPSKLSLKMDQNPEPSREDPEVTSAIVFDSSCKIDKAASEESEKSTTEAGQQNGVSSSLHDEPKQMKNEKKAKSPLRRKSLVIDYDPNPCEEQLNESKSESSVQDADSRDKAEVSPNAPEPTVESHSEPMKQEISESKAVPVLSVQSMDATTSFETVENVAKEQSVSTPVKPESQSLKADQADAVSSSSDHVTAELVPKIKKEVSSPEISSHDVKVSSEVVRGSGRRGRPPSSRSVVAKRVAPPTATLSHRRRSASKKVDDPAPVVVTDQEIFINSVGNIGKEFVIEDPSPVESSSISAAGISASDTSQNSVIVVSEPSVGETIVIGDDKLLNPIQQENTYSDQNVCNLDFDISSMPIVIDNNEYAPSSSGYEKVETVETVHTLMSPAAIEIAASIGPGTVGSGAPVVVGSGAPVVVGSGAPIKVEPKESTVKSSPSFLEKALISKEPNLLTLKPGVSSGSKKTTVTKEKGSASKLVMPVQTSSGVAKMRTVKLATGSKLFTPNSKSPNQFLLLKTSSGQQLLKSSQLVQQPDGKMIILTQNPSSRSGLVVKSISKGEQLAGGKFTTSRIITTKSVGGIRDESSSSGKQTPNILSKVSGEGSKSKLMTKMSTEALVGVKQKISGQVPGVTVSSSSASPAHASVAGKVILPGKQGISKVFLSKAGAGPGTKFVMQSSPTKINLPPALRQKLIVSSGGTGNILVSPGVANPSSTSSAPVSVSKVVVSQLGSSGLPTVAKVLKVQKQGPNILQKPIRKSTKTLVPAVGAAPSKVVASVMPSLLPKPLAATSEPISMPSSSVEAVADTSSTVTPNVVYVAMDNNTYQAVDSSSLLTYDASQQQGQTLYINPGTTPLENILLTIDEKGNVNLAPQTPQFTTEVTPTQDILAKALADTQVLQTEASIADAAGRVAYIEPLPYPAPPLASNVQETSLTLNQPIMTPLEQPSSATPIATNFMLTDQSDPTKSSSQDMFITQLPGVSSNMAFQLVDDTLIAASVANQVTSSNSVETNIDEDLLKINKPLKTKYTKIENTCTESNSFLGDKTELDSAKFIISETPVSTTTSLSGFEGHTHLSKELPDTLNVSDVQSELIITSDSSVFNSDQCDSLKEEVQESNCTVEAEISNGLSSDCGVHDSVPIVTKDVTFSCQESVKTTNELLESQATTHHVTEP
ncbi:unnamed protein product [Bemisia tabaci]|uniref:C2H2-type domain-containing protein n=1 Tax=Bemisia tabaci TaxID=7038 RepID=A0A9P0AFB4_BEMTA|nr:unnamed protein product [Bemisia tabaci]